MTTATTQQEICDEIKTWLAVSEPCTLEELMGAVAQGCGIGVEVLLPQVILAIAALIISGEICQYVDRRLDCPLEYSWLLGEELITKSAIGYAQHRQ